VELIETYDKPVKEANGILEDLAVDHLMHLKVLEI
jgi:hypothetical protein